MADPAFLFFQGNAAILVMKFPQLRLARLVTGSKRLGRKPDIFNFHLLFCLELGFIVVVIILDFLAAYLDRRTVLAGSYNYIIYLTLLQH